MSDSSNIRQNTQNLAQATQNSDRPYHWFETLYAEATGNPAQIPWAKLTPHPALIAWLNQQKLRQPGQGALVVACGLGDDAEALAAEGYAVTAFDYSQSAIAWCRQRFETSLVNYYSADLFSLPQAWQNAYPLVWECRTIQSLPLEMRSSAMRAIANLVAPGGTLLVLTHLRPNDSAAQGPPWPLSEAELAEFTHLGCTEVQRQPYQDSQRPEVAQVMIEYHFL
ncbi:MAG: class I SAM-dependent methyltransferase [Jaaginema sp. PMC 1079.18]|nr:class I SAM-dependent methyltransferase [Jaaginema sp. PMC 1080.18]MEC4852192.1 class I SAM-dependent methyltransferase [Jaaginema sp. PMC 1079.18]MEC4865027.1 class I SAM-dependent methyltransferase [Jaaginema sp. PMC 1078.18]